MRFGRQRSAAMSSVCATKRERREQRTEGLAKNDPVNASVIQGIAIRFPCNSFFDVGFLADAGDLRERAPCRRRRAERPGSAGGAAIRAAKLLVRNSAKTVMANGAELEVSAGTASNQS
jgi:hypothetical protein